MGVLLIKKHHKHMRESFMGDPCIIHYESVYTACTLIPDKKYGPQNFEVRVLSEGVKNLKDPDYKNYRYKFIARRNIFEDAIEEFRKMAHEAETITTDPDFENAHLVAHAMRHGKAEEITIEKMFELLDLALETGDWSIYTSFSFSIVSKINQDKKEIA